MIRRLLCVLLVLVMIFSITLPVYAETSFLNESHSVSVCEGHIQSALDSIKIVDGMASVEENRLYKLNCIMIAYKNLYYLYALAEDGNVEAGLVLQDQLSSVGTVVREFLATEGSAVTGSLVCDGSGCTLVHDSLSIPDLSGIAYEAITPSSSSSDVAAAVDIIRGAVTGKIPEYTLAIALKIKHAAKDNISLAVAQDGPTLIWCNEIYDTVSSFREELESMLVPSSSSGNIFEDFFNNYFAPFLQFISNTDNDLWTGEEEVRKMLEDVASVYRTLAKDVGPGLSVDEREFLVEKLATLDRVKDPNLNPYFFGVEGWSVRDGAAKPALSPAYIAMLASTAVYTPFKSKVGDEDYLNALANIAGGDLTTTQSGYAASTDGTGAANSSANQEGVTQVIELFNQIKDYRKPLYYANYVTFVDGCASLFGTSYDDYKGNSYRATLGNLIDLCEKEIPTAFMTVKGSFELSSDTNAWSFYQANPKVADLDSGENKPSYIQNVIGKYTAAEDTLSSDYYTKTLFEIGNKPGTFAIGQMLFMNSYQDLKNTAALDARRNDLLYINVFGDIVLNDNTVIIPAASNPLLYSADSSYNPFTVAFMNAYPAIAQDADSIKIQSKSDFGKYALVSDKSSFDSWMNLLGEWLTGSTPQVPGTLLMDPSTDHISYDRLSIRKIESESNFTKSKDKQGLSFYPYFYSGKDGTSGSEIFYLLWSYSAGEATYTNLPSPLWKKNKDGGHMLVPVPVITNKQVNIFPYFSDMSLSITDSLRGQADSAGDRDFIIAKAIALNMFWYYTKGSNLEFSTTAASNVLRQDYLISEFIVEMLQGVENVSVYEKNIDIQSKVLGTNDGEDLKAWKDRTYSLLDNVGDFDGVLGVKSSDSDPMFGSIIMYAKQYSMYLVFLFFAMFIFRYMRRGDFLYIVTMTALSGVFVFLFVFVLPSYLPLAYNAVASQFTESLVSQTMLYKAEKYSTTYGLAGSLNATDDYNIQTASLTLYHMTESQIDRFCEQYGVDEDLFRTGGRLIIDPDIGMYLQGQNIKINTDVLFANNPIYGAYSTNNLGAVRYKIFADKRSKSALDYYCPFFQLEQGLVDTLNGMLDMYKIPRATSNYVDGLVKDSFIMFNYANSIPFLYGNDMTQAHLDMGAAEYLKMQKTFPNPVDFLNMTDWIENPTDSMKSTLWYKTMLMSGYYDPVGGKEKREDLIMYVNYHTKRYLINNQASIGLVSDENMIKVTSLMATFFFDTRISELGSWVYPSGFNQEELKLNDVFVTALTGDNERYIKHNLDIVQYIGNSYGSLGLIMLLILICICMVFVVVIKISIPLLYAVLALLIVYRFVTDKEFGVLLKGYFKITGSVIGIYTLFILMLSQLPSILSGWAMLTVLILVSLLLLITLITVFIGFFADIGNMGNRGISGALRGNPITGIFARPIQNTYENIVSATQNAPWNMGGGEPVYVEDPAGVSAATYGILDALDRSQDSPSVSESPRFVFGKTVSSARNQNTSDAVHIVPNGSGAYSALGESDVSLEDFRRS